MGMRLSVMTAVEEDAAEIAALRNRVAEDLTARYGTGPWSGNATERGVLRDLRRRSSWFSQRKAHRRQSGPAKEEALGNRCQVLHAVNRPIYLLSMNVEPKLQRQGVGRYLLNAAKEVAQTANYRLSASTRLTPRQAQRGSTQSAVIAKWDA